MKKSALLVVDMQQGLTVGSYYGHERNNPNAESVIENLLLFFRRKTLPIIHVRHSSTDCQSPLHASSTGFKFVDSLRPKEDEMVITKRVNSAFIGTDLESTLRKWNIENLVVAGMTTNHCISTTVRMGANLGFKMVVVHDATAAFCHSDWQGRFYSAEEIHLSALAHLDREFAIITSGEALQQELGRDD